MRRGTLGVLLWLLPSVAVCAPGAAPRFERIVFVSLDTLRADHLPFYGYPRDTAPFLSGLAGAVVGIGA